MELVPQIAHESSSIGIVVAETHPIFLDGLEHAFRSEPGFHLLASCARAEDVLRAVSRHHPDILVLDLDITGGALALIKDVPLAHPATRVVLLATKLEDRVMLEATRLGAKGIVLKTMGRHLLIQCIRKVHRGAVWLERVSATRVVEQLLRQEEAYREASALLSHRELEVVRMVVAGRANKEIGAALNISEGTVKVHLHHVYEKLHVRGRLELALYVRDKGLFLLGSDLPRRPPD